MLAGSSHDGLFTDAKYEIRMRPRRQGLKLGTEPRMSQCIFIAGLNNEEMMLSEIFGFIVLFIHERQR